MWVTDFVSEEGALEKCPICDKSAIKTKYSVIRVNGLLTLVSSTYHQKS